MLTNLENKDEVIKIFASRGGIEAMFHDCKSGGYNLEGSQASAQRLTNLILLIAITQWQASPDRLYCQLFSRFKNQKYWTSIIY